MQEYLFLCKLLQDQTLLQACGHLVTWEDHWDLETGALPEDPGSCSGENGQVPALAKFPSTSSHECFFIKLPFTKEGSFELIESTKRDGAKIQESLSQCLILAEQSYLSDSWVTF